jgi:hypothetical protein
MLVDDLRAMGFDLPAGDDFTPAVASALRVFQQSQVDHKGMPLRVNGKLNCPTAMAIDYARGRVRTPIRFEDQDVPPMAKGGSDIARRAAFIAYAEYMRASGEQGGNNLGPDVARFQGLASPTQKAWSLDFVVFCFQEAGFFDFEPLTKPRDLRQFMDRAHELGFVKTHVQGNLQAGDLLIWYHEDRDLASHPLWHGQAGIVWACENDRVTTIEGDRGGYPALVRPFQHRLEELFIKRDRNQLREGICLIRLA